MTQRLVLFAKYILTLDRSEPIEDGFVLIQGTQILQVGRKRDLYLAPGLRVLDLGETLLLPGLINAHSHLDFTFLKGRVKYQGQFREWLRQMGAVGRETTASEFRKSIQKGIKESLAFGTTTLCDVASSFESFSLLLKSDLRAIVFFEIIDMAQSSTRQYWSYFLEKINLLLRHHSPTDTCHWGISPHTPFTVSKELLKLIQEWMNAHPGLLTTMHVAESSEEAQYFKKGSGPMADRIKTLNPTWAIPHGMTPVEYLSQNGWMPKLNLGVHLNEVGTRDLKLMSKNRMAIVHCPGSHAYFGHRKFRYEQIKKMKITVCLGTDSLASNQSLSLFREMRLFKKQYPNISYEEILSLVTIKAAKALRRDGEMGRIKPGYLADIIGIPAPRAKNQTQNLYEYVVNYPEPVSFSMIGGEPKLRLASRK